MLSSSTNHILTSSKTSSLVLTGAGWLKPSSSSSSNTGPDGEEDDDDEEEEEEEEEELSLTKGKEEEQSQLSACASNTKKIENATDLLLNCVFRWLRPEDCHTGESSDPTRNIVSHTPVDIHTDSIL